MHTLQIEVKLEQRHIDHGIRGNCSDCPWALALSEVLREANIGVHSVWVNQYTCLVLFHDKTKKSLRAMVPNVMADSIKWFDRAYPIKPTTATLKFSEWDSE